MVSMSRGGSALDFVKKMSLGGTFGFAGDGISEGLALPFMNEKSPIGQNKSMYEIIAYGSGLLMFSLGFLDMVTGEKLLGIGKTATPVGLGTILGTTLWEHHGSKWFGLRTDAFAE